MMILKSPDHRLPLVPWVAVVGEFTTAACFGCLGLFVPLSQWVSWPELLLSWHFAIVVIGSIAIAIALIRRRPESLKLGVVLGAYIGLPSLLTVSQTMGQVTSAVDGSLIQAVALYVIWDVGMLGQVAVVFSCLGRLAPTQDLAPFDAAVESQL
jgi:hypothetical protein